MEKILDKFLRYIAIDTMSVDESPSQPSSPKELNLSRLLVDELRALGVEAELDKDGYVMGRIPGNNGRKKSIRVDELYVYFNTSLRSKGIINHVLKNLTLITTSYNPNFNYMIFVFIINTTKCRRIIKE